MRVKQEIDSNDRGLVDLLQVLEFFSQKWVYNTDHQKMMTKILPQKPKSTELTNQQFTCTFIKGNQNLNKSKFKLKVPYLITKQGFKSQLSSRYKEDGITIFGKQNEWVKNDFEIPFDGMISNHQLMIIARNDGFYLVDTSTLFPVYLLITQPLLLL